MLWRSMGERLYHRRQGIHIGSAVGTGGDVRFKRVAVGWSQCPKHVQLGLLAQFVVFGRAHRHPTVPASTSRSFTIARRMRVFTVPNGCSRRAAISAWLSPSQYASSIHALST